MEVWYGILNGLSLCDGLVSSGICCCDWSRNKGASYQQENEDAYGSDVVVDGLGSNTFRQGVAATIASTKDHLLDIT